jgi:hypothetical protein
VEVTVFENARTQPRAWIVHDVVGVSDVDADEAIHRSQLPDGRRFDSTATALVETSDLPSLTTFPVGPASATVGSVDDGRIRVMSSTTQGGYLVLSDTWYPGWRARIDGHPTPVHRTNLALQGVVVPPGTHAVEFQLVPWSRRIGSTISLTGAAMCLVLLALDALARTGRR